MSPRTTRNRRRQRGAAALEFALVMPLFVLIVYGLVTFGSLFYTQISVSRAASDGARALGMVRGISDAASVPDPVRDEIRLEVIESLAQSILGPIGQNDYDSRRQWLEDNVLSQVAVDEGVCGGGSGSAGVRVRVVFPFRDVRILPPINLPLVGAMDAWMPQTVVGCATSQF
jgi:hypothetical protein